MAPIVDYSHFLSILSEEEKKNAPKDIFFEGNFSLLDNGVRVAVVGSRKIDKNGATRAAVITKALVDRGITVVSGLAEGVDTIAHQTAIEYGGKTISVLGTPLDKCYPAKNRDLLEKIKSEHLVISQFKEGQRVYQSNFPQRNKTMALISEATVIVAATEKSGTRHQAWEATRLGRTVFILENVATDPNLTWPKKLIDFGAIVLTRDNFEEIFDTLSEYSFIPA